MSAPGPRGLALVATLWGLRRDPVAALERAARRYGDVVEIPVGALRAFLVTGPDQVRHVLLDHPDRYPSNTNPATVGHLLGEGLALSEGERLRRHRKLVLPAFARRRLTASLGVITGPLRELVRRWDAAAAAGCTVDLVADIRRASMEITVRGMFGADYPDVTAVARAWLAATDDLRRGWWTRRLHRLRAAPEERPVVALATLDGAIDREIAARRAAPTEDADGGDMLTALLAARDPDGAGLDDREARDEVKNVFFGAYDTTASALVRTWLLLARHPDLEGRLVAEAREVVGAVGPGEPTADDLARLEWTGRVFQEAVRLYPPAPLFGRSAAEDDEIGGHPVPAGAKILISPFITHRHPEHWNDPESFDPERFDGERAAGRHTFAYFPFGLGARQCVGRSFGLLEAHAALAMVAARFRVRPVERPAWLSRRCARPVRLRVALERVEG
jgi:cytochrome P450